jgi:hypothetical protein
LSYVSSPSYNIIYHINAAVENEKKTLSQNKNKTRNSFYGALYRNPFYGSKVEEKTVKITE